MPPKRYRTVTNLPMNTRTVISDLWTSYKFLAPIESSPATIGIHNCLVRCCEYEHFVNTLYQGVIIGLRPKDFSHRLNEIEKKLKDDCQLNIERCPMIARLRRYLEQDEGLFQNILYQIENHLKECMRDDLPIEFLQTYDEFTKACAERNQLAFIHDQAHRMRRFQFHDHKQANEPVNLINLQNRALSHLQLLVDNIKPDIPNLTELLTELKDLLDNSFFIIEHPSPPIATCSTAKKEDVTAKINCRLLCLLDVSNCEITIEDTTPFVSYSSKLNQMEGPDVSYRQPQMNWKTYSIVTTSKNCKIFSRADLSEIVLNQMSAVPQRQQPSTGKPHYGPLVYRIDFHINVTVRLPNDPTPYKHCVIVQSAPFGLITNTSQSDLFAEVFLEDLKSWKSLSSPSTITNLTITDIVESIKRYFIHKTGIQPKYWVMPYIEKELSAVYNNGQISMDNGFHNVLAKILAQIDFMAEHPLLIFFHDDGLFFGICDNQRVNEILLSESKRCGKSVCAIRFGSIQNMSKSKDIGVRISVVGQSSTDVQQYTFEMDKLPSELGLFIIKIALCEASCFENILSNNTKSVQQQLQIISINMRIFVDLYHSEKLRELCPHEKEYRSIWTGFNNKENHNSKNSSPSSTSSLPQNFTRMITAGACANNSPYNSCNTNICTINQTQQVMQSPQLQYPQQQQQQYFQPLQLQPQYYSQSHAPLQVQPSYASFSNIPNIPQNNQQNINSAPVIIVITSDNHFTMSLEYITQLISCNYPQYSSSIQLDRIHHLNLNPPSQPFNTLMQTSQSTLQSSEQNIIYETNTLDLTNFLESNNDN